MSDTKVAGPYDISVEELEAMSAARQKEYETGELLDRELGISEPEDGADTMRAAAALLRVRGIALDDATEAELLDALRRVSR